MNLATVAAMSIKLTASDGGLAIHMPAKTFADLLALARSEGWSPERLPGDWPDVSADTEVLVREIDEHSQGLVSRADAHGLTEALVLALKKGPGVIGPEMCMAILDFKNVIKERGFTVTKLQTGDTVFFHR